MDEEKILFDKHEIVFTDTSVSPPMNRNLPASKITSITFYDGFVRGFLGIKLKTRVIAIEAVGISKPLELYERKEVAFEKYLRLLREFAENNGITLHDKLAS
jgi:hypothetical protein